ncbi:protein spire homolog 1-like [Ornithodoros turicata]
MASEDVRTPKCEIEADGCVPLSSILRAFSAPIGEEQAWALCYQTAKCMCKVWSTDNRGCYALTDTSQLRIHKDGSVHSSTVRCLGNAPTRPIATTEHKLVCSLGLVLFHAVEYGLRSDEDYALSRPFEMLIDRMTSADPAPGSPTQHGDLLSSDDEDTSGEDDCHDEGIEKDSGEDDPGGGDSSSHKGGLTLSKVIEMCASHLQCPSQADAHYKAVCRALVAEALELSTFLQTVTKTTKNLVPSSQLDDTERSNLDDLQFKDWARLWMQVIWELRREVKLKKVDVETNLHPVEYELTPYEMLLDDIRSRRYKLNKVMVNGNLPPRVKKDAHAVILEFIRSRPPLRPASRRKLNPAPSRVASAYDKLMASIRQPQALRLRPVQRTCGSVETSRTKLGENDSTPEPRKRLIAANLTLRLSTNFDEDDPDDAPPSPTSNQPCSLPVQLTQAPTRPNKLAIQGKSSSIETPSTSSLKQKLERRHSIMVCESPSKHPRGKMLYRGQSVAGSSSAHAHGSSAVSSGMAQQSNKDKWMLGQWEKSMECLSLTLEEVVHIRNVLTKAELESLLINRPLYEEVEKRKVCFTCKKTRFSFFRTWGVKCKLCDRTICEKCSTKMHIPTDRFDRIPVYMLSPSAVLTEEYSPAHTAQDVPSAFQLTSGSAPSSPALSRPREHSHGDTENPTINARLNIPVYPPPSMVSQTTTRVPKLRHCKTMRTVSIHGEKVAATGHGVSDTKQESRRPPLLRSRTFIQKVVSPEEDQLRGPLMTVCRDCKGMIRHIILASRTAMAKSHRRIPAHWPPNTLCLSPVTQSPPSTPVICQ